MPITIGRRELLAALGGAPAWPLAARAQQAERMRRIGVLMGTARSKLGESHLATFLRRLEELKWVQDRSARIEVRWWTAGADGSSSWPSRTIPSRTGPLPNV